MRVNLHSCALIKIIHSRYFSSLFGVMCWDKIIFCACRKFQQKSMSQDSHRPVDPLVLLGATVPQ